MLKIIKSGEFGYPIRVNPGDKFVLSVEGKRVHEVEIDEIREITMWCCFAIGETGLAYAIGKSDLVDNLKQVGCI